MQTLVHRVQVRVFARSVLEGQSGSSSRLRNRRSAVLTRSAKPSYEIARTREKESNNVRLETGEWGEIDSFGWLEREGKIGQRN